MQAHSHAHTHARMHARTRTHTDTFMHTYTPRLPFEICGVGMGLGILEFAMAPVEHIR